MNLFDWIAFGLWVGVIAYCMSPSMQSNKVSRYILRKREKQAQQYAMTIPIRHEPKRRKR